MNIFKNKCRGIIAITTLSISSYYAQIIPTIKSPQTYNIEKFGNIPVSFNSGSTSYNINLFRYDDLYNGNGYDISLNYYGTGFVPAKKSNYVGLDWSLDIGGTISREVRGVADDFFSDFPQSSNQLYGYLEGVKTCNKNNIEIYNSNYPSLPAGYGGKGIKCGNHSFELEPDKFSFNFMGNSGYFFIGNDMKPIIISDNKNLKIDISGLSSKQPLHPKLQNGAKCLTQTTTIKITDEKGIQYYFGGNYENLEISYNLNPAEAENRFTITAWNLYKIEYPNSDILEIKYRTVNANSGDRNFCVNNDDILTLQEPFQLMFDRNIIFKQEFSVTNESYSAGNLLFDGTVRWGNSNNSVENHQRSYSATKKSFPNTVLFNGKTIVSFDYERYEKYLISAIPSLKLKNINFYNITGGRLIKTVNLNYYRNQDYFFLETVKMFRKEKLSLEYFQQYNFDYYNKEELPDDSTGLIDYWGYWNNKPMSKLVPNFTLDKNTGDYTITDNTRDSNPALCSVGLIKTITYPTKGKSEFIYEPHQYSEKIDRNSASQFKNVLVSSVGSVGGGRIQKIINYSNDGTQVGLKEYKYISNYAPNAANTKSSGILSSYYRNLDYLKTQAGPKTKESLQVYSSNIIETSMNSSPVLYSEVTEIENNKGYTKSYFTDYKMYPDDPNFKEVYNNTGVTSPISYSPPNMGNINLPYRSNNYKRGKLYKQEMYDHNFVKIKSSTTDFVDISEIIPNNFVTYVTDRVFSRYFFKLYGGSFSPSKKVTSEILNNNLISSTTDYSYQSANGLNVSKLKNIQADGRITETTYKYAHEKANQKLINANIVDTPLETAITQTVNGTAKAISKSETKYDHAANIYPSATLTYDLLNGSSTEVTYDLYDSKGNLQQYTTKDGIPVSLIWGYDQTQPIAKIEGAMYNQVSGFITGIASASDTDAVQGTETSKNALITALDAFRNLPALMTTQITTYTYNPQIGVTSITPTSGVRENYIYDSANRLEKVVDVNGKVLKEYKYNYKN
ncbi:hypothetical protein D1632_15390 [Chryseobacterium nematophagum]|uniref:RHS repeat protein n=1 Tax=Chryseobacterium nematophagum TaxID=2305228 RepID=A0A3M7L862_9FLAO|nr:hypothetical protein [Chryseobacterium nematophagum]RMZ58948.1 hypothetical protein D1632_15390 [Chryseobacterium nematophagum]